ncbi:MAG: hypothetical protein ABI763_11325 [Bacteroidota bacterium]
MKKITKKKLEQELSTAIENVLSKHDSHAISKTKKAIKESVKTVIKKFNKTIKALAERKEAVKAKRKPAKKVSVKRSVATKRVSIRYHKPKNVILSQGTPPQVAQPIQLSGAQDTENS